MSVDPIMSLSTSWRQRKKGKIFLKQDALVIHGGKVARIMVLRSSACTGDCEGCGFCEAGSPLYADAYNAVRAEEGQAVVVETATNVVMISAVLVYLLPLAAFLTVYFLAQALGAENTAAVVCALIGWAAAFFAAKYYNKKRSDQPACTIVEIKETGELE